MAMTVLTQSLRTRFVLYHPAMHAANDTIVDDTVRGDILPEPMAFDVSLIHNDVGALTLTYAKGSVGDSKLSDDLTTGVEIALEIATTAEPDTWVEPYNARFIGMKNDNNDTIGNMQVRKFTCPSYGILLSKARNLNLDKLTDSDSGKGSRVFRNATAGEIFDAFMAENAGRAGILMSAESFSKESDSFGLPWDKQMTISYELGIQFSQVMSNMADQGVLDWRTKGHQLILAVTDTAFGIDRISAEGAGPTLYPGADVLTGPSTNSIENMAHHALVIGDGGLVFEKTNDTASRPWGSWEVTLQQGGVSQKSTAEMLLTNELASDSRMTSQYTRAIRIDDVRYLPLVSYMVGDWIIAPTKRGTLEKVRVQQITLSLDSSGILQASLVLNDRLLDSDLRRAKRQAGITNGAISGGATGGVPDPVDNTKMAQYTFTNANAIDIDPASALPTPLAVVSYTANRDTLTVLHINIALSTVGAVTTDGDVTTYKHTHVIIHYTDNDVLLDRQDVLTLIDGDHVVHLLYTPSVAKLSTHRLTLTIETDDGTAHIDKGGVHGLVEGIGLATEIKWDGTLHLSDVWTPVSMNQRDLTPSSWEGAATTAVLTPIGPSLSESAAPVAFTRSLTPVGMLDLPILVDNDTITTGTLDDCVIDSGSVSGSAGLVVASGDSQVTSWLMGRDMNVTGISGVTASTVTGAVTILVSFDQGATWKAWDGTQWAESSTGMDATAFAALDPSAFTGFDPMTGIMLRIIMPTGSSFAAIGFTYTTQEENQ